MAPVSAPRINPKANICVLNHEDDVETAVKWWGDYPLRKFGSLARPADAFSEYLEDCYAKPKKLARSASSSNLVYYQDADLNTNYPPIKRSPSVSSLSPSHIFAYDDRVPRRYITMTKVYRPEAGSWYNSAYAPSRYNKTVDDLKKPIDRRTPTYSPHTQYYTRMGSRFQTPPPMSSYLKGSQRYMDDYVTSRLRRWDFALPLTYNSYDYSRSASHGFNRHVLSSQIFAVRSTGTPKLYESGRHARKIFKISHRVARY